MPIVARNSFTVSEIDPIQGFEKIFIFTNKFPPVKGIIALHNTLNGPALGGLRLHNYANFHDGMRDALQLARAMTFKNAIMDLPYGGGKSIIFSTSKCSRNDTLEIFAEVLNYLNGKYLTTDDVGTSVKDMYFLRKFTPFARGLHSNGTQIPATSYGVYQAIKATLNYYSNVKNLNGFKVVVNGLGKVGYPLCQYLHKEGCVLYVNDKINELVAKAVQEFNAIPINLNDTHPFEADIFSPCALGNTVDEALLSKLHVKYIIGGENNPLASQEIERILLKKNIVYIPDYLSNAGGVIDIACEGENYSEEFVLSNISKIYDKTIDILSKAHSAHKTPLEICNEYVHAQLNLVAQDIEVCAWNALHNELAFI